MKAGRSDSEIELATQVRPPTRSMARASIPEQPSLMFPVTGLHEADDDANHSKWHRLGIRTSEVGSLCYCGA